MLRASISLPSAAHRAAIRQLTRVHFRLFVIYLLKLKKLGFEDIQLADLVLMLKAADAKLVKVKEPKK